MTRTPFTNRRAVRELLTVFGIAALLVIPLAAMVWVKV